MDGHKEILTMALAFGCFSTVGWFIEGSPGEHENWDDVRRENLATSGTTMELGSMVAMV